MIEASPTELEPALNPAQREAVEHVEGPLLVLAGPARGRPESSPCASPP